MAWYRAGTIAVTNGSTAVVGTSTQWIANGNKGEGLLAPDGRIYEIADIVSNTSITLATPYLGSTASGQAYAIAPTQSYIRDLAAEVATLVNDYSTVADGAVRFDTAQSLTTEQATQARDNIGFVAAVRATVLTGLSTATDAVVDATHTFLQAIGRLQAQITGHKNASTGAHAASAIANTPAGGISATTAQGAINELDSEKASLTGASFTGKVSATHATADDNAVSFSNTSATGYGPFFRGGSSTRYAAIFADKDGTQLSLLTGAGELIVGTNTSPLSTSKMSVLATSSTNGVAVRAGLDANYLYIGQNSSGTDTFRVGGNGNVTNTNNSYGAISDAKLKRDVTDTGPKLSKVLAMRIVNYFLIADPTNTKLLGMIAQELREISPGLVDETPDYADVVVTPARVGVVNGETVNVPAKIESRPTGTTTLGIKYSVLLPMLVKAVQEMHADFDARLSALEQA